MTTPIRLLSALAAVVFAAMALSACGRGGGSPANAVVQVGSTPITKEAFNHWMTVASASTATTATGSKPVLPIPPEYTACIAHLQAIAPKPAKGQAGPTTAQLKSKCEQQYKSLQREVLDFLISTDWVVGEANDLGIKLSEEEVQKQFEQIKSQQFPKAGEFEQFLASSGQTVSDLLLRVKLNLLSSKIHDKVPGFASKSGIAAFQTKWKAETNCQLGYVVPDCRQYTGSTLSTSTTG